MRAGVRMRVPACAWKSRKSKVESRKSKVEIAFYKLYFNIDFALLVVYNYANGGTILCQIEL